MYSLFDTGLKQRIRRKPASFINPKTSPTDLSSKTKVVDLNAISFLILVSFIAVTTMANTNIYIPHAALIEANDSIEIESLDNEDSYFELWAYLAKEQAVNTQTIHLKAKQKISISLATLYSPDDQVWIKRGLSNPELLNYHWKHEQKLIELKQTPGQYWSLPREFQNQVFIQNLSSQKNEIKLSCTNGEVQTAETKVLERYQTLNLSNSSCDSIRIESEYRSIVLGKNSGSNYRFADAFSKNKLDLKPNGAYFLVSPFGKAQSDKNFIVHITSEDQIQKARLALSKPEEEDLARIVNGKIAIGHKNYNANPENPQNAFWSWHLEEVEVVHMGAIWCNTNPQLLEDLLYSINSPTERACPWNFQIVREITDKKD